MWFNLYPSLCLEGSPYLVIHSWGLLSYDWREDEVVLDDADIIMTNFPGGFNGGGISTLHGNVCDIEAFVIDEWSWFWYDYEISCNFV